MSNGLVRAACSLDWSVMSQVFVNFIIIRQVMENILYLGGAVLADCLPGFSSGWILVKVISNAAFGQNITIIVLIRLKLLASPSNRHINRTNIAKILIAPNLLEKGFPGENLPGILGQEPDELKFA